MSDSEGNISDPPDVADVAAVDFVQAPSAYAVSVSGQSSSEASTPSKFGKPSSRTPVQQELLAAHMREAKARKALAVGRVRMKATVSNFVEATAAAGHCRPNVNLEVLPGPYVPKTEPQSKPH